MNGACQDIPTTPSNSSAGKALKEANLRDAELTTILAALPIV